jgi:amino acid adenylation domain-containing protein
VITLARHAATFDGTVPVIAQDDPTLDLASQSDDDLPRTATAESLAYVMYTSGSTGVPKGVGVTHRGVLRLVRGTAFVPWTDITAVLHLASVSFDASTFEIWGPLLNGARSVIVPERLVEFEAIERAIRRGDVDCVWLTAALFNTVIDTRPGLLAGVKWVLAGGEALSVPHVRRALGLLPATQLINGYGPTETTTFACCYPIPRVVEEAATSIPIGRPIANTTVHVLDAEGEHVPVGVTGELFIGGDGVAAGYLNRPELTEQRFLPDRFSNVPGARLYRTGDLVRLRSDGNLVFLGRADRQVKIRGFRIEPGEIEAVLGRHPAVKQCVVVVREDVPGERRLVAYAEADAGALSDSSYRTHMEAALPAYMIPASLVVMPALPLTASGKIDQGRLPADAPPDGADRGARRAPVTTTEQTIAAIWTSVLGVTDLSVTDNFFDVGGHSLAALRVFSAIESACGVSLPLSVLLRAQTIERLARLVEEQGLPDAPPQWAPVVVINDAAGPPLVGVHSLSGDVLEYRLIARYLSPDQRVIGLQAPLGPDEDIDALFGSIEATAERYVRELRRVQPEGPYYLCGWSSGGSIALEMAQRLTRTGSTVALLAVIDSAPHVHGLPRRPALSRLGRQLANLPRWIRDDLLATAPDMLFRRIAYGLRTGLRRVIGTAETDPNVRDLVDFPARHSRWERFAERHFQALRRYVPAPYQGRVSLFSAQTQPLAWLNDADVTWRHLATGVDVYPVPGTHFSMVQEPNVKALAEAMSRALANAARTDGASGRGRL